MAAIDFIGWSMNALVALMFVAIVGCMPVADWPPAVASRADILELPSSQRDVRCIGINDEILAELANHLPELDYVYINSESTISDEGIESLQSLSKLRQIVIEDCSMLTDQSVSALATLPILKELLLKNGSNISETAFNRFDGNQRLRLLDLDGFPQLTPKAITRLHEALPNCDVRVR